MCPSSYKKKININLIEEWAKHIKRQIREYKRLLNQCKDKILNYAQIKKNIY